MSFSHSFSSKHIQTFLRNYTKEMNKNYPGHRKKEAGKSTVTPEETLLWPAVACLALDVGPPFERESNLKSWPPYQVENPKMKKTQERRFISLVSLALRPSHQAGE